MLKHQISEVLAENNRLEVDYSLLRQQYLNVKADYEKHASEFVELQKTQERQKELTAERERKYLSMKNDLPDVQTEEWVLKSQIAIQRQKILDEEEKTRLLTLKLADAEKEKRLLALEQKSADFEKKSVRVDQTAVLNDLKHLYEKNLEQEQETLRLIEQAEAEGSLYDQKIPELRAEIRNLQEQAQQLEARRKFRTEEQELLRNKKLYEVRLTETQIWQNEQAKLSLEKQVSLLESEYERLNEKVALSLDQQSRKRELLDKIMEIDRENQKLKDAISDLEPQVKALQ